MSKGDFPALRMIIEGGRLSPAAQFDQERLNSYRRGTVVYVRFTEEKDRVLVRKWWAILSLVVKQCDTPWKTKEEASEAIKLALGIVNLSKTVGGQFMQYPKSLTELDDPEMTEALENMTELLSRMTGVDVATLKKETAHIREEDHDPSTGEIIEQEPGERPLAGADESPHNSSSAEPADHAPDLAGSPHTDTTDSRGGSVSVESFGGGGSTSSPEAPTLIDCAREMLSLTVMSYSDDEERVAAIGQCAGEWKVKLPDDQKKIDSILIAANAVSTKNRTLLQARSFLSGVLECSLEDLESDNG
ncbi:hypothetical protein FHT87_005224 [Rhizobium sp. BK316]|uniref:hypothetical protein n=1 Tax=Rhizobium sp. BK316 TaxID=2587053 RepID=UPI0016106410|nr:hypothetical protein [Rhizobium sp. BK316]MBB3411271.1 hypothetical protein [Rhizobium sp. BK316]